MGAESAPQSISGVQPGFAVPRYRYRIGRAGSAKPAKFHEGPKEQARNRNKLPGPDFCTLNACPPRSGAATESDSPTRPTTGAEKSVAGRDQVRFLRARRSMAPGRWRGSSPRGKIWAFCTFWVPVVGRRSTKRIQPGALK